jgi:hypothetical protein
VEGEIDKGEEEGCDEADVDAGNVDCEDDNVECVEVLIVSVEPQLPNRRRIAKLSAKSPAGVAVACALT